MQNQATSFDQWAKQPAALGHIVENPHFIEVPYGKETYRFLGRGRWLWKRLPYANWETIGGTHIPVDVVRAIVRNIDVSVRQVIS